MSTEATKHSISDELRQWTGFLGAPVIWFVQMQVAYALVPWACSTGQHWALHAASLLFLVLAAFPLCLAYRTWSAVQQRKPAEPEAVRTGRRGFMGLLGLMISALFVLLIVAQAIPSFILEPCQD